jgi:hypothetical protein
MKLFETIIDEEQLHYNYFDNVNEHIESLGDTYLAQIAGTPSATGLTPKGFAVGTGGVYVEIRNSNTRRPEPCTAGRSKSETNPKI